MEKTQLKLAPHKQMPGQNCIELWYEGKFIGCVYGADGPGIRVFSKHELQATDWTPGDLTEARGPSVIEVRIQQ